jgi:hypothetical protein
MSAPAPGARPPPTLSERARRLFCWTAREKGYLGLGTLLYLNALRWMALVFFVIGLMSAPNASTNSYGPRYPLSAFSGDVLDYAATHVSISNLGAVGWTPGPDGPAGPAGAACSGNGFAALACDAGGWTPGVLDAWDFPCGHAPPGVAGMSDVSAVVNRAQRVLYSNEVGVLCTRPLTLCRCFAGFGGADCSQPVPMEPGDPNNGGAGYCDPPSAWWLLSGSERTAAQAESDSLRRSTFCSGRGACATRTNVADMTQPTFSFCQCDKGFFGRHCEQAETGAETYGSFYNIASTAFNTTATCNIGATPSIVREYFLVKFPPAACGLHGFGELLPLNSDDGSLNVSNFFRVQTRGVCFCEPGFGGEECLGGQKVPVEMGYFTSAASIALVLSVLLLYRHRKAAEQELDDALVTPRDFTIFVNNLPSFDASSPADILRVQRHFEQFGPVETVAPAVDDENIFYFTREKNNALLALQVARETAKAEGVVRAAQGRAHAARALAVATAATAAAARDHFAERDDAEERRAAQQRAGWRQRPHWYPRTSPLLVEEAPPVAAREPLSTSVTAAAEEDETAEVAAAWDFRAGVVRVLAWAEPIRLLLPAAALRGLVRYLDALLDAERRLPGTRHFQRAFVTFAYHADMNDALEAYSERSLSRMVSAPQPRRFCRRGAAAAAQVTVAPEQAAAAAGSATAGPIAEIGSLDIVQSRTGEQRTVNLLFKVSGEDQFVSLSEGLSKALERTKSSFRLGGDSSDASGKAAAEGAAVHALTTHSRSAMAVDAAAFEAASEAAAVSDSAFDEPDGDGNGDGDGVGPKVEGAPREPESAPAPTRHAVHVQQAWEPDEVLWDSLDTPVSELALRAVLVFAYMLVFVLALFVIVTTANSQQSSGGLGFLVAMGVVALNVFAAAHWVLLADVEQNYSVGARMRSVYFKVLVTQLAVTVLSGTLGVYGYPLDAKNGYVQDWYAGAGGFLFRTLLIETLLPALMVLLPIQELTNILFERTLGFGTPSRVLWLMTHQPQEFVLEVRCAGLMRCVILCCAFNAGLPVLNFACAACLAVRYVCDMQALDSSKRLQRSGAELPRALELTLLFAGFVQACMSWAILTAGQPGNSSTQIVFLLLAALSAWGVLGYFSWKRARARDCCCGGLLRSSRWLASHLPARSGAGLLPGALAFVHTTFMRVVLGAHFFGEVEDAHDETGGRPYAELSARCQSELLRGFAADGAPLASESVASAFLLRRRPYELPERLQSRAEAAAARGKAVAGGDDGSGLGGGEADDAPPLMPVWSGQQMRAWLARGAERGVAFAGAVSLARARARGLV